MFNRGQTQSCLAARWVQVLSARAPVAGLRAPEDRLAGPCGLPGTFLAQRGLEGRDAEMGGGACVCARARSCGVGPGSGQGYMLCD